MSQNIINPDRRDPSKIRNKADIGLSRVDNVGVSDILDITKDLVKDEVCKGDRYAEQELKAGIAFEIPLCEFTENSTKLSVTISFLKDDEIKDSITAHVFHTYDTPQGGEPFRIKFDSIGNLILSSSNPISFYLYDGKNNQDFLSLRCDSTLNISYGITSISYYFSDYIVVSNEKEDYIGFKRLTDQSILTGKNVGTLLPQNSRSGCYEYKPSEGDRSKASVASSLPVYDSSDKLVYDESLNPSSSSGYKFPTINGVPFTGSENIKVNNNSTRNITISAKHPGHSKKDAGDHDWEVLRNVQVVEKDTTPLSESGTKCNLMPNATAIRDGFGLCRLVGDKLYTKDSSNTKRTAIAELDYVINTLSSTDTYGYHAVSYGLLSKCLSSVCNILKEFILTTGDISIDFYEDKDLTKKITYFSISPFINRGSRIFWKISYPAATEELLGMLTEYSKSNLALGPSSDDDNKSGAFQGNNVLSFIKYSAEDLNAKEEVITKEGSFVIKTSKFPPINKNLYSGEKFDFTALNSDGIVLFSLPVKLRELKNNSIFFSNLGGNPIYNPIVLSRLCRYSNETKEYSLITGLNQTYLDENCKTSFSEANIIWRNASLSLEDSGESYSVTNNYGVILPPTSQIELEDGSKHYLAIEGYSLTRFIKINLKTNNKSKNISDLFEEIFIIKPSGEIIPLELENKQESNYYRTLIDEFEGETSLENHKYDSLTKLIVNDSNPGFNSTSTLGDDFKFYLILSPKPSSFNSTNFGSDANNFPTMDIIPSNGTEEGDIINGNSIKLHFSQFYQPRTIVSYDNDSNRSSYGLYSQLIRKGDNSSSTRFDGHEDVMSSVFIEELKIPIKYYSLDEEYEDFKITSFKTSSSNFKFSSGTTGRKYGETPTLLIDNNFLKFSFKENTFWGGIYYLPDKSSNIFNYLAKFILSDNDLKLIYQNLNDNLKISDSCNINSYPKELLPPRLKKIEYDLTLSSPQVPYLPSKKSKKKVINFNLENIAISNYCPSLGGSEAPSTFIHYRQKIENKGNDATNGYTFANEQFELNAFGEGKYYKIDCYDRTWGGFDGSDAWRIHRRLGNILTRFGFSYNLSSNFASQGDIEIYGQLKITAPRIDSSEDSDYDIFINKHNQSNDRRLKKFIDDAFKEENKYSWKMYSKTIVKLNKASFENYDWNLSSDGKSYNYLKNNMEYDENSLKNLLVFYPQNPKDLTDDWVSNVSKSKYSVLNYASCCSDSNFSEDLSSKLPLNPGVNDFSSSFPQVNNFPPVESGVWSDLVKIYPRMTVMRPVTEPTVLELTLRFYERLNDELIPIDVNNGIDNNELTFKFDLWPHGHEGIIDEDKYK